jgi:Glycosyl hydrolase-like 10
VERLYREVKKAKRHVKVGISPFGIWRPGHPRGIQGFDQYAELYADPKKWFNEGWVDYLSPQLYWPIKQEKQSYPKLLEWWAGENKKGRHLWPGIIPSRVTGKDKGWPAKEIFDQVEATRQQKGATGNVHFSMKPILNNTGGVADQIAKAYRAPALVPASPWLGKPAALLRPKVSFRDVTEGRQMRIEPPKGADVRLYVVRTRKGEKWTVQVKPAWPPGKGVDVLFAQLPDDAVVTAVDRLGNESADFRLKPRDGEKRQE